MVKRILSVALCLIMALSIVAPVVQATDASTGTFDNVTFENVNVDGTVVGSTSSVQTPTQLGSTASTETVATTAPDCDCGNEGKDVIIHADSCMLKKYYQGICKQSSLAIWGMWSDLPTDAREYILAYLSWTDNAKLQELEDRLSTGAFAEDSVTVDGTDITATNIPEYGSLTVTVADSAVAEQYASEQGWSSEDKLFAWDISVVTASGQEWQPDGTTVKLELSVPGVTLHKYATVYVIHVDDAGNATQIPAQVTADGKIAFETTGFSTFAAFTVDFDYEGVKFSIPGKSSIYLSELFEQLRIPHDVSEVTKVVFSDNSLVTVAQDGSDWLLTSLKAFTSNETLTITLNDGTSFVVAVTDAVTYTYPTLTIGKGTTNQDGESNGAENWYLTDSRVDYQLDDSHTEDYDIVIDGTNATNPNKTFEIVLQRSSTTTGRTLYVDLHTIWIKGGANLVFRTGGTITDENTDQIIVRQVRGRQNNNDSDIWWFGELFWVENGSLELKVTYAETDQKNVRMVFDWDSGNNNVPSGNGPKALVSLRQNASSFKANQCVFQNTLEAAIVCRANDLDNFIMKSCEFQSTSKPGGNGAGIYVMSNTADSKGYYVDIHNFELTNCTFNNSVAAGYGGAMCLMGYIHKGLITSCTFTGCSSSTQSGGAIDLSGCMGAFTIQNTTFSGCTSYYRGGAITIRSTNIKNDSDQERWTRSNSITISGCSFTDCSSTNSHGGAIAVQAQLHTLKVSNSSFSNCSAGINGGGISIDGQDLPDTFANSGSTNPNWAAALSCLTCTDYGSAKTGHKDWGSELDKEKTFDRKSWIGTVSIDQGCTFTKCSAASNGGSIEFANGCYITNSATISGATIDGSKALGEGSAIFWSHCYVKSMSLEGSKIRNCYFSGASSLAGGTVKTTGNTTLVLSVDGCTFTNNTSHHHGGGLYWNAARGLDGLACKATVNDCLFEGNSAVEYGGGIYVESDITITKCNIKYNTAGTLGGGIAQQVYNNPGARMLTEGGVSELKLDPNTWVHHNTAKNGGGISIRANATGSITNRDPDNDQPFRYTVRFELNGAAVYENTATNNGGGIYFIAEKYDDAGDQFEVDGYTKVILINAGTGTAAAVYKNVAANNGGGIYMDSSNNTELRIQDGYISSNKADSDGDNTGNGGGIYMTGKNATCIVEGGIVGGEGNDSAGDPLSNTAVCGGGIAISGGAKIEMTGGEISYNNLGTSGTSRQGGGIWLDKRGDNSVANTMTLSDGTVKYNSTPGGNSSNGGGIYVGSFDSFTMNGGTIEYNDANNGWGGGIFVDNCGTLTMNGGTISYNSAGCGGGAAVYGYGWAKFYSGVSVIDNTAVTNGGGLFLEYCDAWIYGGEISRNSAGNMGGGIYTYYQTSKTNVYDGTISENTAGKYGGGIAVADGSTVSFTVETATAAEGTVGASIIENTAAVAGGGIYVKGYLKTLSNGTTEIKNSTLTVTAGSITNNKAYNQTTQAYGNGGGIYADEYATVRIGSADDAHGTVSHNEASNGGGVYAVSGADVTITNGYLTYNKAIGTPTGVTTAYHLNNELKGTGGGVYIANGKDANDRSTFTLNGTSYAIYGNLADFAADDVFANGKNTQLNVPTVASMNLSEYKFKPEGWFEDYPTDDTAYSSGLNLAAVNSGIGDGEGEHVYRLRFADPLQRVLINDTTDVVKVNADTSPYVCMTLGMPTAVNDTVVIDYGKPVDIHVLTNEVMYVGTPTLIGIGPKFDYPDGEYGYNYIADGFTTSKEEYEVDCGIAQIMNFGFDGNEEANADEAVVRFSINTMSMTKETVFSYVVQYSNSKDASGNPEYFYYYADVTVIPATTIYYEDDFADIDYSVTNITDEYDEETDSYRTVETTTSGGWTDATPNYTDSTVQDEDRPGAALKHTIDADNVYGYDSHYKNCTTYSLGSAKKVTVNANKYATATFDFWGTGFDVISLTSADSGTIGVIISQYGENDSLTLVENYLVDTYYGYTREFHKIIYTYVEGKWIIASAEDDVKIKETEMGTSDAVNENPSEGDTRVAYETKWVVDTASNDTLYQVPVIKVNCKNGYGHYQVKIVATYADFFNHKDDGSYDFYLDAIRIYDPANDGTGNTVIQDAYTDDGEGWPSYSELRNMLIDLDTFNSTGDTDKINGVVFIDGIPALNNTTADNNTSVRDENKNELDKTAEIKTYMNFGPNNELYLAKGQAVAFTLNNPTTLASVQIAMKSVGSSSVPVKIGYYDATTKSLVKFKEFAKTTDKDESIATATDLYYDISDLAGKTVVIQNTSTTDGPILSITNIKTTYTEQPTTFRLLRTIPSEIEDMVAALNAVEEEEQPDQPGENVPGTDVEENPVTGDLNIEIVSMVVLTACVMMLAVLALPKARKRNAK